MYLTSNLLSCCRGGLGEEDHGIYSELEDDNLEFEAAALGRIFFFPIPRAQSWHLEANFREQMVSFALQTSGETVTNMRAFASPASESCKR